MPAAEECFLGSIVHGCEISPPSSRCGVSMAGGGDRGRNGAAAISQRAASYSFSSLSIGTAAPDRYVIVGLVSAYTAANVPSAVSVNGIDASPIVNHNLGNVNSSIWIAPVPSGTSATVIVTHPATCNRCGVILWRAVNVNNPAATDTDSADGSTTSFTIDIAAGGICVGFTYIANATTTTWTGLTEDVETGTNLEGDGMSGASLASSSGVSGLTVSADNGAFSHGLVAASFR